jgi:hypothetical protein
MFGISAFAEAPFASLAGQTVVVSITGVSASGAVGTVVYVPIVTVAVTGVSAAGAVGDVAETNNPTENGVSAVGSVGTVVFNKIVALTGVQARGQLGATDYFYWTTIDDNQTPSWQNVNNSQTPDWEDVEMTV